MMLGSIPPPPGRRASSPLTAEPGFRCRPPSRPAGSWRPSGDLGSLFLRANRPPPSVPVAGWGSLDPSPKSSDLRRVAQRRSGASREGLGSPCRLRCWGRQLERVSESERRPSRNPGSASRSGGPRRLRCRDHQLEGVRETRTEFDSVLPYAILTSRWTSSNSGQAQL